MLITVTGRTVLLGNIVDTLVHRDDCKQSNHYHIKICSFRIKHNFY